MIKNKATAAWVGTGAFVASFLALAAPSLATGPTYDITPVTTSVTSELTSNLPIILGVIGALMALGLAVRAVRKFVKV
jgi:cell division protein FtsX